ncbi:hypothetical protein ACMT4L_19035 [Deinococcus sp. A31D244]
MLAALLTFAAPTTPAPTPLPTRPPHRLVTVGSNLNWPGMGATHLELHVR